MSCLTEKLNKKIRKRTAAGAVLFLLILVFVILSFIKRSRGDAGYSWVKDTRYIVHALGGINGDQYTNSREALINSYERGGRVIEADIEYTSDGEMVLIHNWKRKTLKNLFGYETESEEEPLSLSTFKEMKVYGKYTTMTFRELMEFMKEHRDMMLVLDGKYEEEADVRRQYGDIYKTASLYDPEIPDRMIPQIYNEEMYSTVMEIYDWKSVIFTWYQLDGDTLDPEKIFTFCDENNIRVCTMEDEKENPLIDRTAAKYDINIYVHTINDENVRDRLFDSGVAGIYTDFLFDK